MATAHRPLRLWPGIALVVAQWLLRFVVPVVRPDAMPIGVLGGLFGGVAVVLWWLFFSRARWSERLGAVAVIAVALAATRPLLHESIATGAMGMLFFVLVSPPLSLALVAWAAASRGLSDGLRRVTMVAAILIACVGWTLAKTGGFTGNFDNDLSWRWSETPEERLLAQRDDEPKTPAAPSSTAVPGEPAAARDVAVTPAPATPPDAGMTPTAPPAAPSPPAAPPASASAAASPVSAGSSGADWPGFRGRERDSVIHGVRIETDWSANPPVELWRRPIGPGWSSFAVRGTRLYTQEQRGDDEVVSSYSMRTGEPLWRHRDRARFWESNGGAGPRGTPTLNNGRVYTLGATGIVNALDADNGAVVWSRNAASDTGATLPTWGFAGSPLVIDDAVIVAASGALAAYDRASGKTRWMGPAGRTGYSSPHLLTIGGVPQILLVSGTGAISVAPGDGTRLWEHPWRGYPIVQPAQTADGDILIAVDESSGVRRIAAARGDEGWTVEERWTSNGLKPYFNDFVVHGGHAYGFDGRILACIDLADGRRKWKGGRYGGGQLVLLPDQDLLLVLSEDGELALVGATTDQFRELARFPALDGKTWNHPVLAGDTLLVRNAEEMAAFRLSLAGR